MRWEPSISLSLLKNSNLITVRVTSGAITLGIVYYHLSLLWLPRISSARMQSRFNDLVQNCTPFITQHLSELMKHPAWINSGAKVYLVGLWFSTIRDKTFIHAQVDNSSSFMFLTYKTRLWTKVYASCQISSASIHYLTASKQVRKYRISSLLTCCFSSLWTVILFNPGIHTAMVQSRRWSTRM